MNINPFQKPPPTSTWDRLTQPLRGSSAERAGRTGLLGIATVVVASAVSAVVSALRDREGNE